MDLRACVRRLDLMIAGLESENMKYSDTLRELLYERKEIAEDSITVVRNRIRKNKSDIKSLRLARRMVLKENMKEL